VDINQAIKSTLVIATNEYKYVAEVDTDFAEIPAVNCYAGEINQVVLNLIVNAAHAIGDVVKGTSGKGRIKVSTRVLDDQVEIAIADTGKGIPVEVRSRIFDPLFTTKPVGLGLGLGLSICHGIVSAHGGSITVDSTPGRGSTFRVVLPAPPAARQAATTPTPAAEEPRPAPLRRRRVLVIDDEPTLGSMIRRVLDKDCHVELAIDGREGLERLETSAPYDVVLCDLMMPDMTGMDLFAEIAKRRPGLERRFVFMTGGAFTPRASEFLAQVKNRRLEKPFETALLKAIVASEE